MKFNNMQTKNKMQKKNNKSIMRLMEFNEQDGTYSF